MRQIALSRGAKWVGTTTQGQWLTALGIDQRADALAEFAPQHRTALFSARDRLTAPDQMGELFKVMACPGRNGPTAPGSARKRRPHIIRLQRQTAHGHAGRIEDRASDRRRGERIGTFRTLAIDFGPGAPGRSPLLIRAFRP